MKTSIWSQSNEKDLDRCGCYSLHPPYYCLLSMHRGTLMTREARAFNQNLPIETTYGYKTIIRHWKCMLPKCEYEANSLKDLKQHKHDQHAY